MNLAKTIGIVLVIAGELLLLGGVIICIKQWPDIFKGLFVGPSLIIIGIVIEILGLIRLDSIAKTA
jgi:hypothetical protein